MRKTLILLFCLMVGHAFAQAAELRYKEFTLKPKLAAGIAYDQNFFKGTTQERNVLTTYLKPGFQIRRTGGRSLIQLHYLLNAIHYEDLESTSDNQKAADSYDYIGHELAGRLRYKPSVRITLGLDEGFYLTRDPAFSDQFGDPTSRDKYYINRLTPSLLYEFGPKLSAGLRCRHTVTDYLAGSREDSVERRGIFDLEYNLNRNSRLDFRYQLWTRGFNRDTSDYDGWETDLTYVKEFPKITMEAGVGYVSRTFDGYSENGSSRSLPGLSQLLWHFSIFTDEVPWFKTPKTHIEFRYDNNYNDQGFGNAYFLSNRFTLSIGRLFFDRWRTDLGSFYRRDDFEDDKRFEFAGRVDNTYGISGGLGYQFPDALKGIKIHLHGGHEWRNSNYPGKDFENDFIALDFRLGIESDLLTLRPSIR